MSKIIDKLSDLKDGKVQDAAENQQTPETTAVPEQKKTLKDRVTEAKKASVSKRIEKEKAKIKKLEQKLNPVEKDKKVHIDKKKILIGAGIGAAVLGSIGAACLKCAGQTVEESTCEDGGVTDCYEQTMEPEVPENSGESEA